MGQIFKGQDILIIADVNTNITGTTCYIKYRTPTGIVGSIPATIVDSANGIIQANLTLRDSLALVGNRSVWGYVVFNDGREVPGEATQIHVYEEGYLPRSSSIYN